MISPRDKVCVVHSGTLKIKPRSSFSILWSKLILRRNPKSVRFPNEKKAFISSGSSPTNMQIQSNHVKSNVGFCGERKIGGPGENHSELEPVSRNSPDVFGPEKPVVKLQSACFKKLIF